MFDITGYVSPPMWCESSESPPRYNPWVIRPHRIHFCNQNEHPINIYNSSIDPKHPMAYTSQNICQQEVTFAVLRAEPPVGIL